jgi:hypothetical protein
LTGAALRLLSRGLALAASLLVAGCGTLGDFGRIQPGYVTDGIHDWMGAQAAASAGLPVSIFPLTDDERLLRDRAFQLIEPAYDRNRWYSFLNEYGVSRIVGRDWCFFNLTEYDSYLKSVPFRSATARYSRLNDAVRNDVVRIAPFVSVARRVLDMDVKRSKSLEQLVLVSPGEVVNAQARIAENALVIAWVQQSLVNRTATYAFALERLAIETPAPMAAEVDRSLTLLKTATAENRLIPGPDIEPGPIVHVAPYPVPPPPPVARVATVVRPR